MGEKRRALWQRLRHLYKYSSRNLLLLPKEDEPFEPTGQEKEEDREPKDEIVRNRTSSSGNGDEDTLSDLDCSQKSNEYKYHDPDDVQLKSKGFPKKRMAVPHVPSRNTMDVSKSGTVSGHRHIAVYASGEQSECSVELLGDSLRIFIPEQSQNDCQRETGEDISRDIQIHGDGYQALSAIVRDLVELMKEHKWKFTFGQKRIGGDNPKTGNMWLYARKLEGKLLDNLITEKIRLVQDLASLTTEEEKDQDVLKRVRQEVAMFEEEEVSPDQLSAEADSFVGNAIKKNFKAETGRFPVLMMLGKQFREFSVRRWSDTTTVDPSSSQESLSSLAHMDELVLTKEEEIPARHLGALTRPGALMGDTFENVPLEQTVLDTMNPFYWRNLLRAAVQPRSEQFMDRTSSMALTRIWTCGLTDAGLHNLFLTEDSLWLFDLGQPQLHSAPGFLTKFLFSFFHTLGMQEKEGSTEGEWVRRFDVHNETDKLRLTKETGELLASAYEAFGTTLDRIVMELFDGDDGIRWLLIQYVTLQLLSDASFCLQRWTVKGGGRTRSYNHQKGIEKWLWRALWDMYVAFEINSRETWSKLNVEHPSHRESVFYSDMSELLASGEHRTSSRSRSSLNRMFDGGSKPLEPMSESENEDESEGE